MMLLEDHGKRLFKELGLRVPEGRVVTSRDQVGEVRGPVVVKALVPVGGRGKAGGVVRAENADQVSDAVDRVLGLTIGGFKVGSVYLEEPVDIARELYLSISIDRSLGLPALIVAGQGGIEVEALPPGWVHSHAIHPFVGVGRYVIRDAAKVLDLRGREEELGELIGKLWKLFRTMDCELVEVNPLVLTRNGELVATDAKVVINDDSLFRHPEIVPSLVGEEIEVTAKMEGFAFVKLEGDIGVIANGAGLTMATLDLLPAVGGRAGAFMDLGGTDDPGRVRRGYEIMASSGIRVVLINIFGGVTRCDTVARGLLDAIEGLEDPPATIVRIRGVNEDAAMEMLRANGIAAHADMEGAVRDAVTREAGQ
jgi:succinyl-CoA synthetase beta subunit